MMKDKQTYLNMENVYTIRKEYLDGTAAGSTIKTTESFEEVIDSVINKTIPLVCEYEAGSMKKGLLLEKKVKKSLTKKYNESRSECIIETAVGKFYVSKGDLYEHY